MISERFYSEELEQKISAYISQHTQEINSYQFLEEISDDIIVLLTQEKSLQKIIADLNSIELPELSYDVCGIVNNYYKDLQGQVDAQRSFIESDFASRKQQAISAHQNEVSEANQYNADLKLPFMQKHQELLAYKEALQSVFNRYEISPLDMKITDEVTASEFGTLIDASIAACNKYQKKEISSVSKILEPLQGESNLTFTFAYAMFLLVVLYFLTPVLAIPIFVVYFMSIHNMHKDVEKLRLAYALMSEIDYDRFVDTSELKEVEELDVAHFDSEMKEELESVQDITEEWENAMAEAKSDSAEVMQMCAQARTDMLALKAQRFNELGEQLSSVQKEIARIMAEYKPFPTVMTRSVVMQRNYTLGRFEGKLDVKVDVPRLNIVFNSDNRDVAVNNMKLYLANAILSVRVQKLLVDIIDPTNLGADFIEFVTNESKDYIKINEMDPEKCMKEIRAIAQSNVMSLGKLDIDAFNRRAEEQETPPKGYRLIIVLSGWEKYTEKKDGDNGGKENKTKQDFMEFMRYSSDKGVIIWLLDNEKYPNTLWVDGSYDGDGEALEYTIELGEQAVETFTTELEEFKDSGIPYDVKFGDKFIPREKWWTWDTIKGIKMPFGLEDGKPDRGLNVALSLGDGNVHALLGGATGAGKSAEINQHMISMLCMYPPSELVMVYADLKNVEAAKFTRGFDNLTSKWLSAEDEDKLRKKEEYYVRISRIPHLQLIAGTTDGEYALSIFEYLMEEMARRQKIINKAGLTKIQELREQILEKYNIEHNGDKKKGTWADMRRDWEWYKPNVYDVYGDLPRMLIIIDEFQVMYNTEFVPQRTIDSINGKITAITKLARAMGCHFWFTSQSMKGTMSKDVMGNFSLRAALRCTDDVSNELLGNGAAATITDKFGYMYTNDSAGTDKAKNRFWRVPFLHEKKLHTNYIDILNDMCVEFNETHRMAEFYDEKILVPSRVFDTWYESRPDLFTPPQTFILGERAMYSTNKAPITMQLTNDTGENIMIAAFEKEDMLNLAFTVAYNIKKSDPQVPFIVHCVDKENYALLGVDELCDPRFVSISSPDQDIPTFIEALEAMIAGREKKEPPYSFVYVMLINWERAEAVSVSVKMKLQDKFKELLRRGPLVGIHFIFVSKEKLEMPKLIPNACAHKICGLLVGNSVGFFTDNSKVEKLPSKESDSGLFAFYNYGTQERKFRIYQHEFKAEIKSRDIVI